MLNKLYKTSVLNEKRVFFVRNEKLSDAAAI